MSAAAPPRMTADAFIAWSLDQPKTPRRELEDGVIVRLEPECVAHARAKTRIVSAFVAEVAKAGVECEAFVAGLVVPIDESSVFVPDALVRCGAPLAGDVVRVVDPIIVVEVLSPSSHDRDSSVKLAGYFQLPSVRHYLIATADLGTLIHHRRDDGGAILTRIVRSGVITLDPPGLTLDGLFPPAP